MASPASPPKQAKGILSLPDEILEMILSPIVRHSPETMAEILAPTPLAWWQYLDSAFAYCQPQHMRERYPELCLNIAALKTCKRFHQVGAPLLYASMLVVCCSTTNGAYEDHEDWEHEGKMVETWYTQQRKRLPLLAQTRARRFTKVLMRVDSADMYSQCALASDGEQLAPFCDALMAHQPVWHRVVVDLIDYTAMNVYGMQRARGTRLLYEVGRMHGTEVECSGVVEPIADDVAWAIRRPERTPLIWPLYGELIKYFDYYDRPVPVSDKHTGVESNAFREEAKQAAEERDLDKFFAVLERAVEYVKEVVELDLGRPDTVFGEAKEGFLKRVKEEGDRLVSAKEGGWRAGYVVQGV